MISDISIGGRGKEEVRSGGYGLDAQEGREPSLLGAFVGGRRRRRTDRRHCNIGVVSGARKSAKRVAGQAVLTYDGQTVPLRAACPTHGRLPPAQP